MRKERIPIAVLIIGLMLIFVGAAFADELNGIVTVTPTASTGCYALTKGLKYTIQANLASQSDSVSPYLSNSVKVWTTQRYSRIGSGFKASDGGFVAPQDGGYVFDAGILLADGGWSITIGNSFWQVREPVVLKDTDTFTFNSLFDNDSLCYKAGTTADAGVSAITLTINEAVR